MRTQLLVALLCALCATSAEAEPPPVQAPSGSIRGVVRDAQGPVAGVRVLATRAVAGESLSERPCVSGPALARLAEWSDCVDVQRFAELVARHEGAVPTLAEVRSQADGAFVLEGLGAGVYTLWAESPESAGLLRDVTPDTGGVELVLGQGSRLSGQVTRGNSVPVAGARVTAVFEGHSRFFETLTDARGHYALGPIPRGEYAVVASHPDGASREERVRLHTREARRSLLLWTPERLSGRVWNEKGLPVAGAEVRLRGEEVRDTRTDAQGRFAFVGLPFYVQDITATYDGLMARQENVSFREEEWSLTLREPLSEVVGVVRDTAGQPVAGALVRFADDAGCVGSLNVLLTKTDARGRYRLGPLPRGDGWSRAFTPDHRRSHTQTLTVSKGRRTLDFTLQPGFLIEGQLLDARELPVQDARVAVFDATTREYLSSQSVDADGRFSLERPNAGPYLLSAQGNGPGVPILQASAERITAPALGLRPRLLWPFTVEGALVDDEEQPVAGAWVSLWAERDSAKQEALTRVLTDVRGRFSLQAPAPGRYQVRSALEDDVFSLVTARTVEVGTEPVQTRLRFEAGHSLSGVVVDRRGRPLRGVSLTFQSPRRSDEARRRAWVQTGADGRFSFEQVAGEPAALSVDERVGNVRFHLATFREEDPSSLMRLEPSAREVRVVLVRAATLRGRFVRADGSPVQQFTVNGEPKQDPAGRFEWPIERDGPLTLTLSEDSQFSEEPRPTVQKTVDLQLEVDQNLGDLTAVRPASTR